MGWLDYMENALSTEIGEPLVAIKQGKIVIQEVLDYF